MEIGDIYGKETIIFPTTFYFNFTCVVVVHTDGFILFLYIVFLAEPKISRRLLLVES